MNLSTFEHMKHLDSQDMVTASGDVLALLQSVLLMMLDDIMGYCDTNHIRYELGGGSALGAIRHQGFIPWDDDIDLNMPRQDYDRFITGFGEAFPTKYTVECPELTPEVGIPSTRIRLNGTVMRMHDDREDNPNQGIFIDIFPIENTFNQAPLRKLHGLACMGVGLLYSCRRHFRDRRFYFDLSKDDASYRRVVLAKVSIGALCAVLPMKAWSSIVVHTHAFCSNEQSAWVVVPSGRGHFFGELYKREDLVPTERTLFEGRMVPVPKSYREYLTHLYGQWEELPPEDAREYHSYLALSFGTYGSQSEERDDA